KHHSFNEEREWRLVYEIPAVRPGMGPPEELRFRAGRLFVVPYLELSLPCEEGLWKAQVLHIASVRHGPTHTGPEAKAGLQSLLWARGYRDTEVLASEAPLRR